MLLLPLGLEVEVYAPLAAPTPATCLLHSGGGGMWGVCPESRGCGPTAPAVTLVETGTVIKILDPDSLVPEMYPGSFLTQSDDDILRILNYAT